MSFYFLERVLQRWRQKKNKNDYTPSGIRGISRTCLLAVPLQYTVKHPKLFSLSLLRWIKFEEKVEKGGERWSKPHVATLSLHSLMELKMCIEKGTIMLDLEASTLPQVVGKWV